MPLAPHAGSAHSSPTTSKSGVGVEQVMVVEPGLAWRQHAAIRAIWKAASGSGGRRQVGLHLEYVKPSKSSVISASAEAYRSNPATQEGSAASPATPRSIREQLGVAIPGSFDVTTS
jgi:hypothetical protein